uniref:Uncharacterized protein n=1 Tax=Magallana gigas TaxID=29159 RepID=A0A8W8HS72_MAGGI
MHGTPCTCLHAVSARYKYVAGRREWGKELRRTKKARLKIVICRNVDNVWIKTNSFLTRDIFILSINNLICAVEIESRS